MQGGTAGGSSTTTNAWGGNMLGNLVVTPKGSFFIPRLRDGPLRAIFEKHHVVSFSKNIFIIRSQTYEHGPLANQIKRMNTAQRCTQITFLPFLIVLLLPTSSERY